jgi:hypothetical protein
VAHRDPVGAQYCIVLILSLQVFYVLIQQKSSKGMFNTTVQLDYQYVIRRKTDRSRSRLLSRGHKASFSRSGSLIIQLLIQLFQQLHSLISFLPSHFIVPSSYPGPAFSCCYFRPSQAHTLEPACPLKSCQSGMLCSGCDCCHNVSLLEY